MTSPLIRERLLLAGIPVLHVHAAALVGPTPTVLLYHGWASRPENLTIMADALACTGLRVLLPDAPQHGERAQLVTRAELVQKFWPVVFATIAEAPALLDAAIAAGLADPQRLGIGGNSMGGVIAAGILTREPRLKAAAIDNATISFEWLEEVSRAARGDGPIPPDLLAQLRAHDPFAHIAQIAPRPLLLQHGTADTLQPIDGTRRWVAAAQPHYEKFPEHLQVYEAHNLNHYLTIGMISNAREWFTQYV